MRSHKSILDDLSVDKILRLAGHSEANARGWFLCPAHSDHRPSAHIVPGGKGWKCFSCGAGGGLFALAIALGLGRDYPSAARALEERTR